MVGCAAAIGILMLGLGVIIAWRKVFGHEPPLHEAYASKKEHAALIAKMEEELKRERFSRKGLYEKVEKQGADIASLKTETESQSEDLGNLKVQIQETQNRIDAVPERTIRLLRETKGLI